LLACLAAFHTNMAAFNTKELQIWYQKRIVCFCYLACLLIVQACVRQQLCWRVDLWSTRMHACTQWIYYCFTSPRGSMGAVHKAACII
jgi:hypothetical protein